MQKRHLNLHGGTKFLLLGSVEGMLSLHIGNATTNGVPQAAYPALQAGFAAHPTPLAAAAPPWRFLCLEQEGSFYQQGEILRTKCV